MIPTLAQVSSLNSPFEKDVEDYAAGKCEAIEFWWGKLETYLAQHTVEDVRQLLASHNMATPVASFQGGLLINQGDSRRVAWDQFENRLEIAKQLGVHTLVVAEEVPHGVAAQDLERFQVSLRHVAERAAEFDIRIALEFQARSAFCNNLQTAVALVEQIGHSNLGICLDAFHFFVGPSKQADLQLLTRENLFHVHFCDVADTLREFATDGDRILPGDGEFPLEQIVDRLYEIEYSGHVSVELMNPRVFLIPARSFGEIAMTALRKVLGQAESISARSASE